jgi:septum formation protein
MARIILASGSSQRAEYFRKIFRNFEICVSDYDEDNSQGKDPKEIAISNAMGKARAVMDKYDEGIIVAADTFVYLDGKLIGKPCDEADAMEKLKMQSGRVLDVYTGIAVADAKTKEILTDISLSKVQFTSLSEKEIADYVHTGEWNGKAGGWAILGRAGMFIEKIDGCMANVAGLPLNKMYRMMQKLGLNAFEE